MRGQCVCEQARRVECAFAEREVVQVGVVEDQDVVRPDDQLGEGLGVVAPGDVPLREPGFDDAREGRM